MRIDTAPDVAIFANGFYMHALNKVIMPSASMLTLEGIAQLQNRPDASAAQLAAYQKKAMNHSGHGNILFFDLHVKAQNLTSLRCGHTNNWAGDKSCTACRLWLPYMGK